MIRLAVLAALLLPATALAAPGKDDPYGDPAPEAEEPAETRLALPPADGSDLIQLLQPIKFTTGSTDIALISQMVLMDVVAVIQDHPQWTRIDIGGHTDSVGSADANRALSQGRAEAVLEALVKGGVARSRLTATGYGESKPLVKATDEMGHARNRRVEFKVSATKAEEAPAAK